ERALVPAVRAPDLLAVTPDESMAVVANRLPAGDAADPKVTACVTLIDLDELTNVADVALAPNSTNVHGVAVSPDGAWAYVVHNIGRTIRPTEHLERGFVNANAVSIVDVAKQRLHATLLLDQRWAGSANPWGVAIAPDGGALWFALSGIHQLVRMDLRRLHAALAPHEPRLARWRATYLERDSDAFDVDTTPSDSSDALGDDPATVQLVLSTLPTSSGRGVFLADVCSRIDLPGKGPRAVAISPDGGTVAVALYFSGTVAMVHPDTDTVTQVLSLGPQPKPSLVRRGEMVFHDARRSYQEWLSCSTCHPDGRVDGLNWDLLNDGIGNPKSTRSLLWSHRTPPVMSRGVRANMDQAAAAGFQFILFQPPGPGDLEAVRAYLRSLEPEANPFLVDGRLSEKARRGKRVFHSAGAGCSRCHPPPLFTDLRMHDVGTHVDTDLGDDFDTPSLVELWRTAPYLHHGRAQTLRQVLSWFNASDRHGNTAHLSDEELDALVAYLKSL
ncbi:hypothetical protein HQ560_02215, partial [bacterium]|nr:hypothetical protein [bacterium]